jgi:group I intron endonuclease
MIGIYKITSPKNKIYIGQSINISIRFKYYKSLYCKKQPKLYRSFLKYGVENHIFEIIEKCNIDLLNERERYYQDLFDVVNKGLNCSLVGYNNKSGEMSLQSKNLMSINHKKIWLGKTHSDETKIKMSESLKKIHQEKRGFNNILKRKPRTGNGRNGLTHSEETKQKIRFSNKKATSRIILDLNTGVFYNSIVDYSNIYGISKSSIIDYLMGRIKKSKISNIVYV